MVIPGVPVVTAAVTANEMPAQLQVSATTNARPTESSCNDVATYSMKKIIHNVPTFQWGTGVIDLSLIENHLLYSFA
jgi:hypothetical protein